MRPLALASLGVFMLFGATGCEQEQAGHMNGQPMDYDVIGDDTPADFGAAIDELSTMGIVVPDPVTANDPVISQEFDARTAERTIAGCAMDDEGRMRFRRIVGHLRERFGMLRQCMSENDDPRLRRLAYGAAEAYRHGMRALRADEPRTALRYFHQSNRAMNLALRICREDGERP